MHDAEIPVGLTFDDVLLVPAHSCWCLPTHMFCPVKLIFLPS